ncbi:hypothetical protein FRX31_006804 [Thalictrum thalictroides]|uniref:Uncharacterized protein n=1 Tax=Thalictrum thalictroides TaxID=46969 RepID=A0A7J6X4W6_THATH|nr:hypothetical protein FRX31_006804 [Thalictrum thalictroides]
MATPNRRVRSARDQWWRARRVNSVLERLFATVRKSMCEQHFDGFQSFRGELSEFSKMVGEADPVIEGEIAQLFPQQGQVTQELWRGFKMWLKSEKGEPVRDLCMPWIQYAKHSHLICDECRGGSEIMVDFDSKSEEG